MQAKVTDPVCGMTINPYEALAQTTYQGKTYHFCSQECKQKFDRAPEKFRKQVPEPQSQT